MPTKMEPPNRHLPMIVHDAKVTRHAAPKPVPILFVKPLQLDTRPIFARGETPCHAIDEALAALVPGQRLSLTVPFEPLPLYTKLGGLGFKHRTQKLDDNAWRVEFWKTAETADGLRPLFAY